MLLLFFISAVTFNYLRFIFVCIIFWFVFDGDFFIFLSYLLLFFNIIIIFSDYDESDVKTEF